MVLDPFGKPWTQESLDRLLGPFTFENFEQQENGCIYIAPVRFWMRIGLWFGKPVQVIIACNHFVRIRETEYSKDEFQLKELDATFIRNADNWRPPRITFPFAPLPGGAMLWAGNMVASNNLLQGILTV